MHNADSALVIGLGVFLSISFSTIWICIKKRKAPQGTQPLVDCELGQIINLGIGGPSFTAEEIKSSGHQNIVVCSWCGEK